MKALISALTVMIFSGCATTYYEAPRIQSQFFDSMAKAEKVAGQTNNDFVQKKVLLVNMTRTRPTGFNQHRRELKSLLQQMNARLSEVNRLRLTLNQLNGEFSALSRGRDRIQSTDRQWKRAGDVIKTFQTTIQNFNAKVAEYSSLSKTFSDTVSQNGLYQTANVLDLQENLTQTVLAANKTLDQMNGELKNLQKMLKDARPSPEMEPVVERLQKLAQKYLADTQRIEQIKESLRDKAGGQDTIGSLSPRWSGFQKLIKEAETKTNELKAVHDSFEQESQHLVKLIRANQ